MIPVAFINDWKKMCPWSDSQDVEQDLIITRCLKAALLSNFRVTVTPNTSKKWDSTASMQVSANSKLTRF